MGGLRSGIRWRRFLVLACALTLAWGFPAHAGQLRASKNPRVSGPLDLRGKTCAKDSAVHEGKTLANLQICVWLYEFDSMMETDATQTYGVGWVQTAVDPVNGWCATKIDSEMYLPDEVDPLTRAPSKKLATKKKTRVRVKLKVDADGNAAEEARISQAFNLFPATLSPTSALEDGVVRTTWKGRESSKLAFALGAEMSWGYDPLNPFWKPSIRGGLGHMSFVKSNRC